MDMKQIDLWASDSEDSLPYQPAPKKSLSSSSTGSIEKDDYYKTLYEMEVRKREEAERLIATQQQEIEKLKAQLALFFNPLSYKEKELTAKSLSEEEDDIHHPNPSIPSSHTAATTSTTTGTATASAAAGASTSSNANPLAHVDSSRWDELAQEERERRNRQRRSKVTRSLRMPLPAARSLQLQQHSPSVRISTSPLPFFSEEKPAGIHSSHEQQTNPTIQSQLSSHAQDVKVEEVEEGGIMIGENEKGTKEKFSHRKRHVLHDMKSLRRLPSRTSVLSKSTNPITQPTTRNSSMTPHYLADTNDTEKQSHGIYGRGDDLDELSESSGWDSEEENQTEQGTTDQSLRCGIAANANVSMPQESPWSTEASFPYRNEEEIDMALFQWVQGKTLIDMLNTVHHLTSRIPANNILAMNSSKDVRKVYLRVVRYCHPDKLALQEGLTILEEALLSRIFTILSDAYNAYAQQALSSAADDNS